MRLSEPMRRVLEHVAANDGTSMFPAGYCPLSAVKKAAAAGYIEQRRPDSGVGMIRNFITPAGREAIGMKEGEDRHG